MHQHDHTNLWKQRLIGMSESDPPRQPTVSVIVPTKNEAGNIELLLSRLEQATRGTPTEVVFVDDSSDDTPQTIRDLQHRFSLEVVLIVRPPDRRQGGLGGAVVERLRSARGGKSVGAIPRRLPIAEGRMPAGPAPPPSRRE